MILDRREFLKTSLSGAAALACWVEIPALARAKGKDELIRRTERPTMDTTPPFIRAIPLQKAIHPDTLLALEMNGKPLAPNRGLPVRLVVPGWVGDDWMRHLVDVEVRADEPKTFYYDPAYRFPVSPGAPGAPIPADQMKPMTKVNVKSLIGSLEDGQRLRR